MKKRNINIDLIKCIAVFSVISVHFFNNTNFFDLVVSGSRMYILSFFRTLFMICVPLFLITTGYLMKNKELDKMYYFAISRVLIIYFLDAIMYLGYRAVMFNESFTIRYVVRSILEFDIGYSWYIEMYIGLFLIIPFINIIYNNLLSKKQKQVLIFVMLVLTSFSGVLNIRYHLISNWWGNLYPITYYFIGCYLNEFGLKFGKFKNILLFFLSLLISLGLNLYVSIGGTFLRSIHNDWGSILNVIPAVLIFAFIINLKLDKINNKVKRIIVKVSELSLGIYLTSAIIDNFLYVNYYRGVYFLNFLGYFKIVPLVFVLSTSLSIIINIFYKIIDKYIVKRIYNIFINL